MPRFEFDPKKSARNEERHGLSLADAEELWRGPHVVVPARDVLGEARCAILGLIWGRVHVAIFTMRGDAVRLISCHRADRRWEIIYASFRKEEGQA